MKSDMLDRGSEGRIRVLPDSECLLSVSVYKGASGRNCLQKRQKLPPASLGSAAPASRQTLEGNNQGGGAERRGEHCERGQSRKRVAKTWGHRAAHC